MKINRLRLPIETAGDKNLEFLESERAAVGCENCYCAQYAIICLGLYVNFPALGLEAHAKLEKNVSQSSRTWKSYCFILFQNLDR